MCARRITQQHNIRRPLPQVLDDILEERDGLLHLMRILRGWGELIREEEHAGIYTRLSQMLEDGGGIVDVGGQGREAVCAAWQMEEQSLGVWIA